MMPRVLHPREWATKLVGTDLEPVVPHLPPNALVVVVEDGEMVVGCWAALQYWHCEGIWVHPDYRKQSRGPGVRLVVAMGALLKRLNVDVVLTAAMNDDVKKLIEKAGGKQLPGEHFAMPVGGL